MEDLSIVRPLKFGIAKSEWELFFDHLGHKVTITGETGKLDKRVKLEGEYLHIEFNMSNTGSIEEVIGYAKAHIDEYVDDYKEEIGELEYVRM